MAAKAVLLCAFVLLVKSISGQFILPCGPPLYDYGCGTPYVIDTSYGYDTSYGCCSSPLSSLISLNSNTATLSNGGNLIVTCYSPITPTGIVVSSDLALNGILDVCGSMPFISAVAFQTELPSSGVGYVDYSCGSGSNVVISGQTGLGSFNSLNNLGSYGCNYYC